MSRIADTLVASAPAYVARLDARGLELAPVLGADGPAEARVRLEPREIRVGESIAWRAADGAAIWTAAPGFAAPRAGVARSLARGWTEHADFVAEGVELSVRIDEPPVVQGDLTIAYALDTALPSITASGDDGLRVGDARGSYLRIGAVSAIDADGRHWPGSIRVVDDTLEIGVARAVLGAARYPLWIDPLVGSEFGVSANAADGSPDIAFNASVGYLAVWRRRINLGQFDLLAQAYDAAGTPIGGVLTLVSQAGVLVDRPAVGAVEGTTRFLVAWELRASVFSLADVRCASIDGLSGNVSAAVTLAAGAGDEREPDVGGRVAGGGAWVAWSDAGQAIAAQRVQVAAGGTLTLVGALESLDTQAGADRPSIADGADAAGRSLVVWEAAVGADREVFGAVLGPTSVELSAQNLSNDASRSDRAPDVDGGGAGAASTSSFEIVWQSVPATGPARIRGVNASVASAPTTIGVSAAVDVGSAPAVEPGDDAPSIGCAGGKYLVGWIRNTGALTSEARIVGLNDDDCTACDVEQSFATGSFHVDRIEVASARSGGSSADDRSVAIWSRFATQLPFPSAVQAQLWQAFGDGLTPLGPTPGFGVCGAPGGGLSFPQPAVLGNDDFAVTMPIATPPALFFRLLIAPDDGATPVFTDPVTCNTCFFHFNPFAPATSPGMIAPVSVTPPTFAFGIPCNASLNGQRFFFRGLYLSTQGVPSGECEIGGFRIDAGREQVVELSP